MSNQDAELSRAMLSQSALLRWDGEGGAGPDGPQTELAEAHDWQRAPQNEATELAALQVRIVALESLVVALLAGGSDRQIEQARLMVQSIVPRQACAGNVPAMHAAIQCAGLVDRGGHLHDAAPS